MKIQELLSSEDKWSKSAFARDKNGKPVSPLSKIAVKWCLAGAIFKCYPYEERENICLKIQSKIKMFVTPWNDTHTYKEVVKLVKELDI